MDLEWATASRNRVCIPGWQKYMAYDCKARWSCWSQRTVKEPDKCYTDEAKASRFCLSVCLSSLHFFFKCVYKAEGINIQCSKLPYPLLMDKSLKYTAATRTVQPSNRSWTSHTEVCGGLNQHYHTRQLWIPHGSLLLLFLSFPSTAKCLELCGMIINFIKINLWFHLKILFKNPKNFKNKA